MNARNRTRTLLTVAMVFCGFGSTARADLLLYEPFAYPLGEDLNGQTPPDGMGMTGSWEAWDHKGFGMTMVDGPRDPYQWRSWDGVAHNVAQTGNFISLGYDGRAHVMGKVTMDSSVTDTFTSEAVTWMSMVAAQGDVPWGFWPLLAVGAGDLIEDRGNKAADQAIGGGGYYGNGNGPVGAHYWNDEDADGTFEIHPSATLAGFSYPAELLVLKITWDDPLEDGKDKIQAFQFDVNEGAAVPTEEAFDLGTVSNSADLDQSLFTTLSYGGGRIELDEIRLATTFDDVINGVPSTFDPADFDQDGNVDIVDVNLLTAEADLAAGLAVPLADAKFDLSGNNIVDSADLDLWLAAAATIDGYGSPYLKGDANLDADVDVWDFDGSGDAQVLSENLGTASGAVWGDGDFNGDDDVDVWDFDGSGDAQVLSSNLGSVITDVGPDAADGTAEALYNAATGELSFDVGTGVAVVGIGSAVMYPGNVNEGSIFGAPIQSTATTLAYFNTAGLPTGEDSVGLVLPAGLTADDMVFSYTPASGQTTYAPVMIVPEPSTIALLFVGAVGLLAYGWRRRMAA